LCGSQNFVNPTEIGQYAQYAYGKLKEMSFHFANKLSRLYPPSRLELEANRVSFYGATAKPDHK
jgi:hypothetical protein